MKKQAGQDMIVCPILVGRGRSLLGGVSTRVKLDLLETQQYRSGDVMLRYARSNEGR